MFKYIYTFSNKKLRILKKYLKNKLKKEFI